MGRLTRTLVTMAATMLALSAFAQSAKDLRDPTPFIPVGTEPPAKLIVDPPSSPALAHGVVLIQYHAENVHIVPVFGLAALNIFPPVGHLHINVDCLPWHWADTSETGTIDVNRRERKVTIDLVDGNRQLFPGPVRHGELHRV